GLRAGSVCSVIANRVTGQWGDNGGILRACQTGAEAIRRLTLWDNRRVAEGGATLTATTVTPLDRS
uniref:nucleoside phosphorylase n=1 Tax=Serratia marcescens TaxID=615 RepID=UPI0013DBF7D9